MKGGAGETAEYEREQGMRGGAGETAGYEGKGWGDCRV